MLFQHFRVLDIFKKSGLNQAAFLTNDIAEIMKYQKSISGEELLTLAYRLSVEHPDSGRFLGWFKHRPQPSDRLFY
jgi:hypothetical protein